MLCCHVNRSVHVFNCEYANFCILDTITRRAICARRLLPTSSSKQIDVVANVLINSEFIILLQYLASNLRRKRTIHICCVSFEGKSSTGWQVRDKIRSQWCDINPNTNTHCRRFFFFLSLYITLLLNIKYSVARLSDDKVSSRQVATSTLNV